MWNTHTYIERDLAHSCDRFSFHCVADARRSDDNEAVIRNRLEVYQQQTAPLIAHYRERGLLASVDAAGSVEEISKRIATLLEN